MQDRSVIEIEIDPTAAIGVIAASIVSIFFIVRHVLYGPKGFVTRAKSAQVHELEVRARMSQGEGAFGDLLELADGYMNIYRFYDAERTCQQAIQIGEREFGARSESLIPALKAHARVLRKLRRSVEARNVMRRVKQIRTGKFEEASLGAQIKKRTMR